MPDNRAPLPEPVVLPAAPSGPARAVLFEGLFGRNAIAIQVLGLCSALAVTSRLESALVMGLAVAAVCACSGFSISLLRNYTPVRVRLIVWICLIASFVIVADQFTRAFFWDISLQLGPYLALIITNCILLGRAESFASQNRPLLSALDGAASGLGYALILASVAFVRELVGSGRIELTHLFGFSAVPLSLWSRYAPNDFLLSASGAFIVLGLLVALFNHLVRRASSAGGPHV